MTGAPAFVAGAFFGASMAALFGVLWLGRRLEQFIRCNRMLATAVARSCVDEMNGAIAREGNEVLRRLTAEQRERLGMQ